MTGETATTTQNRVPTQSSSTKTEFISENVYAETRSSFTKVTCKNVYAFQSIATSNDFSEIATSLESLLQIGVEIEFPNGRTELLVFQPSNLLHYPVEHRKQLVTALFDGGEVWVSEYDDLFTPGLFPKTWEMMVVPNTSAVEEVFAYRDAGVTSLYSDGKEQALSIFGGVGLLVSVIGAGGIASLATGSILPILGGLLAYFGGLKYGLEPLIDTVRNKLDMETTHLWAQRMTPDESEMETMQPIDSDLEQSVRNILTRFSGPWTEATVLSVDESADETTLCLLTAETATEFEVTCQTPADKSDRYLLNRLIDSIGVGSVRMLEGERIQVGISSLGREDDVTKNNTFRLQSI